MTVAEEGEGDDRRPADGDRCDGDGDREGALLSVGCDALRAQRNGDCALCAPTLSEPRGLNVTEFRLTAFRDDTRSRARDETVGRGGGDGILLGCKTGGAHEEMGG